MNIIFDPSLVLCLPLYELDGTPIKSTDTYGYSCTVTGAIWTPEGRLFDNSDDKIIFPSVNLGNEFTIEYISKRLSSSSMDIVIGDPVAQVRIGYDAGANTGWVRYITDISKTPPTLLNTWQHFAWTRDSSNKCDVYLNAGPPIRLFSDAVQNGTVTVDRLGLTGTGTGPLDGLIGEARIYNRALTPLEIQHNFLSTKWRYQ